MKIEAAQILAFQVGTAKLCHSPKVDDIVENIFFQFLDQHFQKKNIVEDASTAINPKSFELLT